MGFDTQFIFNIQLDRFVLPLKNLIKNTLIQRLSNQHNFSFDKGFRSLLEGCFIVIHWDRNDFWCFQLLLLEQPDQFVHHFSKGWGIFVRISPSSHPVGAELDIIKYVQPNRHCQGLLGHPPVSNHCASRGNMSNTISGIFTTNAIEGQFGFGSGGPDSVHHFTIS